MIVKVDNTRRNQFYRKLETHTRSFIRRGVSIMPIAHSDTVGNIEIQIYGSRGIVKKDIIIYLDKSTYLWVALSDGVEHHMTTLSELPTFIRSKIQSLNVLVQKV